MQQKEFIHYLQCYGADLTNWPSEQQDAARQACKTFPEFQRLLEQEKRFEEVLQQSNQIEAPSENLAERILYAARSQGQTRRKREFSLGDWFRQFLTPKPAIALAMALLLGFWIGFRQLPSDSNLNQSNELASLLYDEEEERWAQN